ncbi:hypothetical protein TrLO_g1090 [Triparma laevis f. longispina]|uniref:Uncharacterized protein n=1 Tax=Triparma laevis f. longispina TaxID=1714387 RepID=A0A9W7FT07_9STRA|nr:hypothetical protein TrLO_g1090 [Triparma laevis f. longispina]
MSKWLNSISNTLDNLDSGLESTVSRLDNPPPAPGEEFAAIDVGDVGSDKELVHKYNELVQELKGADGRNADLARELNQLNKSFLTLQQSSSQKDSQLSSLTQQVETLESTLSSSAAQHKNVDVITDALQSEVSSLRKKEKDLEEQLKDNGGALNNVMREKEEERKEFEKRLRDSAEEILTLQKNKPISAPNPYPPPPSSPPTSTADSTRITTLLQTITDLKSTNSNLTTTLSTTLQSHTLQKTTHLTDLTHSKQTEKSLRTEIEVLKQNILVIKEGVKGEDTCKAKGCEGVIRDLKGKLVKCRNDLEVRLKNENIFVTRM